MEYITFKQFIYTINIRNFYLNEQRKEIKGNEIIRINWSKEGETKDRFYIDIGWYDFFNKDSVWDILETYLSEKILNSYVTGFLYNEDFNCIEVWLQEKVVETLQEYQN